MGKLIYICLGVALVIPAVAQSAANFETSTTAPAEVPADAADPAKPTPDPGAVAAIATPSRFIGEAELETYLSSQVSGFQAQGRLKDPFGHYQDPDAKPVVRISPTRIASRVSTKATPLSEIISRLEITTIMPGENSFLLGNRLVNQGQELPLVWRGKNLRVEVTGVTSSKIGFRDVQTGETGFRTMDILPVGMRIPDGRMKISTPGMVRDRPDAPIQLDSGEITP